MNGQAVRTGMRAGGARTASAHSQVLTGRPPIGFLRGQEIRYRRNLKDMGFMFISILASFIAVCVIFAFLWTRLTVVNSGYEISKANTRRSELIEQNKRLRVEFMKLKSPERIEKAALDELGLAYPTGEQIATIRYAAR